MYNVYLYSWLSFSVLISRKKRERVLVCKASPGSYCSYARRNRSFQFSASVIRRRASSSGCPQSLAVRARTSGSLSLRSFSKTRVRGKSSTLVFAELNAWMLEHAQWPSVKCAQTQKPEKNKQSCENATWHTTMTADRRVSTQFRTHTGGAHPDMCVTRYK